MEHTKGKISDWLRKLCAPVYNESHKIFHHVVGENAGPLDVAIYFPRLIDKGNDMEG